MLLLLVVLIWISNSPAVLLSRFVADSTVWIDRTSSCLLIQSKLPTEDSLVIPLVISCGHLNRTVLLYRNCKQAAFKTSLALLILETSHGRFRTTFACYFVQSLVLFTVSRPLLCCRFFVAVKLPTEGSLYTSSCSC